MEANFTNTVTFIALSAEESISISSSSEIPLRVFFFRIVQTFGEPTEDDKILLPNIQKNSLELQMRISTLIDEYSQDNPQIHRLGAYFKKINSDEHFVLVYRDGIEKIDGSPYYADLYALNEGLTIEEAKKVFEPIETLKQEYTISLYGREKHLVGEREKSKRICRFCNNIRNDGQVVTFKNKAHSISEALGNKKMFLLEECDACNSNFSRTSEQDIIRYLSLHRTLHKVPGKDGLKSYKDKKHRISQEKDGLAINFLDKSNLDNVAPSQQIRLEPTEKIIPQNIHKTLVKYLLSVVDSTEVGHFTKTINWINGELTVDELPPVIQASQSRKVYSEPEMMVFLRKADNNNFPYALGEFYFTNLVYFFIVPMCTKDHSQFTTMAEFISIINKFGVPDRFDEWEAIDLSHNVQKQLRLAFDIVSKSE